MPNKDKIQFEVELIAKTVVEHVDSRVGSGDRFAPRGLSHKDIDRLLYDFERHVPEESTWPRTIKVSRVAGLEVLTVGQVSSRVLRAVDQGLLVRIEQKRGPTRFTSSAGAEILRREQEEAERERQDVQRRIDALSAEMGFSVAKLHTAGAPRTVRVFMDLEDLESFVWGTDR